jgi:FtsP/CotA-like multicopper oxidase with cupredoxin domain
MVDMGMAMNNMDMGQKSPSHPSMSGTASDHNGMNMNRTKTSGGSMPGMAMGGAEMQNIGPIVAHQNPANYHYGIGNRAIAQNLRYRLAERGTGLKDAGHRVLTYSQLRSVKPLADQRKPAKTIEVHLTGNMDRYMWSFDGVEYTDSTPIKFPLGERIRLVLINDTMMEHPIHLHGQFMALENRQGEYLPFKHTISVLPASRVALFVSCKEPGRWFFHCHLLYHMAMGMARVVLEANPEELSRV